MNNVALAQCPAPTPTLATLQDDAAETCAHLADAVGLLIDSLSSVMHPEVPVPISAPNNAGLAAVPTALERVVSLTQQLRTLARQVHEAHNRLCL